MVQMAVDQVIDVIPVRNRLVSAVRSVHVTGFVAAALMRRRALIGVARSHRNDVLVDVVAMWVMEMTVVQVIDVTIVLDRGVPAAGAMFMIVVRVFLTTHRNLLLNRLRRRRKVLRRVFQRIVQQPCHVPVGQAVVDMPGLTAPTEQACPVQGLQPCRHGAELVLFADQFAHAALAVCEHNQKAETLWVTHRPQQFGCAANCSIAGMPARLVDR
jgi:hypothetical protein